MSQKLTIYQKPSCSKCRIALRLLKGRGVPFEAINYYEKPFTAAGLTRLLKKAGLSPKEMLRKDEPMARKLGLGKEKVPDKELIRLMTQYPDLIQRPIVVRGNKAVLGRPESNIERLF